MSDCVIFIGNGQAPALRTDRCDFIDDVTPDAMHSRAKLAMTELNGS
jgi:hypothetical protein